MPDPISVPNIVFRDLVITGVSDERNPCGEFHLMGTYLESRLSEMSRLTCHLHQIIDRAGQLHRADNCMDDSILLKPDKKNNITRLITNEFFFYTKTPLSLDEFQQIQQEIADIAKTMPENLHLILASFAVKVKGRVMNVVSHVACSQKPKISFTVKNNTSNLDPVYTAFKHTQRLMLPNYKNDGKHKLPDALTIAGVGECKFSFNCITKTKTADNISYYVCTEICIDHKDGQGKHDFFQRFHRDLQRKDKKMPFHYSHVIVSNCIKVKPYHCFGALTQADPLSVCRGDVSLTEIVFADRLHFGTPFRGDFTNEYYGNQFVPDAIKQIHAHNQLFINPSILPSITKLENYISLKENEAKHISLAISYKYKLFTDTLNSNSAEKISAVRHLVDHLIHYTSEPLTPTEIQILQKGKLGEIIANLGIDLNESNPSFRAI